MVSISAASGADAEAILALQKLAYECEARLYDDWTIPPLTQNIGSLREEFVSSHVLKATVDGRLAGSVRARAKAGVCAIGRLIVHPSLQGRGIGSALLRAIEGCFSEAAAYELFTGDRSEANIRLYRRHGYSVTRTERLSDNVTIVFMKKPGAAAAWAASSVMSGVMAPCIGDCGRCAASGGTKNACSERRGDGAGVASFCRLCGDRLCGESKMSSESRMSGRTLAEGPVDLAAGLPVLGAKVSQARARDRWQCPRCGESVCLQQDACVFCGREKHRGAI